MNGKHRRLTALHVALRPAFAICLFLSQFTSRRTSLVTANRYVLGGGAALIAAGILLWAAASMHLREAQRAGRLATSGPFRTIRHPIYVSIYVLSIGLGFLFFARAWFLVLVAFFPFWYWECRSEEEAMEERYGEAYAAYRDRTKMFVPGLV